MAKLLKLRRGTDTQHTTFTGAEGEVTVNTTNDSLHVHDGTTAGGHELAKADLSNAAGADIPGTLRVNKLIVDDDNQGGAVCSIRGDDGTPWAFVVGNDTYSSNENDGLRVYQADTGTITMDIKGNSSYEDFNLRANNGTTAQNCLRITAGREVTLHHEGAQKFQTTSTGIDVTGTVTCDGLTSDGQIVAQNTAEWQIVVKDSNSGGSAAETGIAFRDSGNITQGYIGHTAGGNNVLYVFNELNEELRFGTGGTGRCRVQSDGHFTPVANNTYDLGTTTHQWRNGYFDGTVNCDGINIAGNAILTGGDLAIGSSTDTSVYTRLDFEDSGGVGQFNLNAHGSAEFKMLHNRSSSAVNGIPTNAGGITSPQSVPIYFANNGTARAYFDTSGHFQPYGGNTYDLGTSSNRWRNVYTNDLNLSNEGGTNDVDGTWGSWTIQEGEDDLFLLNRRNGKKYKFNLSEVN